MFVPITIGIVYLIDAALLWRSGAQPLAIAALVLSPVAVLLTLYLRRLAAALISSAYFKEQAEAGLSREEAIAALDGSQGGVKLNTDGVAQWPFTAMLVVTMGSLVLLGYALIF